AAENRFTEARSWADQALAAQRRRLRPGHPALAATLAVMGTIAERESPTAAEPLFRQALTIRRAALTDEHPYTAQAESLLGECLALQHQLAEALPLLRHSAQTLRAKLGDSHRATREAWKRLEAAESQASISVQ